MSHIYQELFGLAQKWNGGVIDFINILDAKNVEYVLGNKKPSAFIKIETSYGTLSVFDRKKDKKIRMDIPHDHPLATHYTEFNGYLWNENNKSYQDDNKISVFFDKKDFEKLIDFIREHI